MPVEEQAVKDTVFIPDHPDTLKAEIARLLNDKTSLTEKLDEANRELEQARARSVNNAVERDAAVTRRNAMQQDWQKLNELINEYADEHSLCDEYENTIDEWNAKFHVLQLTGRERDFEVPVTVTLTYEIKIPVRATSVSRAEDQVGDMDECELIENYVRDVSDYENYDIEIGDAEVSS